MVTACGRGSAPDAALARAPPVRGKPAFPLLAVVRLPAPAPGPDGADDGVAAQPVGPGLAALAGASVAQFEKHGPPPGTHPLRWPDHPGPGTLIREMGLSPTRALVLAVSLAACSRGGSASGRANDGPENRSRPEAASVAARDAIEEEKMDDTTRGDCAGALAALTEGRLGDFNGVAGCTRDSVGGALGPGRVLDDGSLLYAARGVATTGIEVTFRGDEVYYVEVLRPEMTGPPQTILGAPEARMRSHLGGAADQLVYAGRGLAVHYRNADGTYVALVGFSPMTADAYAASPLAELRGPIRDPVRRR